ncbi:hypothetical protein ACFL5D_05380 [Candidatus Neomarinimicrobiota bacterium]
MKKLSLISVSIFLLTNLIYSQDIINETGKDGKFIVRDAEQQEALIVEDSNVNITGELRVETMTEGKDSDAIVVWDPDDKKFKTVARIFSRVSPLSERLDTKVGHSIGYSEVDEEGNEISASVQETAAVTWNYLVTDYGYIRFGPANSFWGHIQTDAPRFMFNKPVYSLDGSFSSHLNTNLNLQIYGTPKLTILASNGNVGIGTTIPSAKLEVAGQVKITGGTPGSGKVLTSDAIGLASWQTPAAGGSTLWTEESGGNIYRASGNVGIGTTSPNKKLSLGFDGVPVFGMTIDTNGNPWILSNAYTDGATPKLQGSGFGADASAIAMIGDDISFRVWDGTTPDETITWNEVMRVASGGNVGIGTTSPTGALDIVSTSGALIVPRMTTTQRNAVANVNGSIIYNTSTNAFNFYESGSWVTK